MKDDNYEEEDIIKGKSLEELMKPYKVMDQILTDMWNSVPDKEKKKLTKKVKRTDRRENRPRSRYHKVMMNAWYHQKYRSPKYMKKYGQPIESLYKRITEAHQDENGQWYGTIKMVENGK